MISNATNALFDANVWIALVLRTHLHHATALASLPNLPAPAFCRVTQATFLRLLSNESVMGPDVCNPTAAWSAFDRIVQHTGARFLSEPLGLADQWKTFSCDHKFTSANNWSDAYLAAFAKCAEVPVVTFDQGFRRFHNLDCLVL